MGGFTVTELLVSMLFAGIVVATLYGFFRDQLFTLISQETKTTTLEDVRGAANLMARELRNAGAWGGDGTAPDDCSRIKTATATEIHVQADVDESGDCDDAANGESVTYVFVSTPNPPGDPCPGSRITRNGDCLVANVVIPAGNNFMTYYNAASPTPLSFPISESDLTTIKRVKITFSVQETNQRSAVGGIISSTLSTSVLFRNE